MNEFNRAVESRANSKYVPAIKDDPPDAAYIDVTDYRQLPAAPQTTIMPHATYHDRARGFGLATAPLAGVVGIVAALIGISAFSVPILSVGALLLVLAGFAATWLVAYVGHLFISPDGALFLHVLLTWRYLGREQKERIKRYKGVRRDK